MNSRDRTNTTILTAGNRRKSNGKKGNRPIDSLKKMECYLPRGADWYDYWTSEFFTGGQTVTVSVNASIDVMPLFIRAERRIPTQSGMQYAEQPVPVIMTEYRFGTL